MGYRGGLIVGDVTCVSKATDKSYFFKRLRVSRIKNLLLFLVCCVSTSISARPVIMVSCSLNR